MGYSMDSNRKEFWTLDMSFVRHCIRAVMTRMRKITITLEESLAQWVCAEAARKETTVSRLLAGILDERMIDDEQYERAMQEALPRKPFFKSNGPYLSREAIHDREQDR